MNVARHVLMASMVGWLSISPITAFAESDFTIVTKPVLGFKEGTTMYKLGQTMAAFLASFGPAEKIKIEKYDGLSLKLFAQEEYAKQYLAYTKTHCYVNDGVMITEDKEGVIKGVIFSVVTGESVKSANVKTEEGITSGASLREIIKIYGEPLKKTQDDTLGYQIMHIYYRYGNDVLSFMFKDGVLQTISINAQYLPYLSMMKSQSN